MGTIISHSLSQNDYKPYGPYRRNGKLFFRNYNRNLKTPNALSFFEWIRENMNIAYSRMPIHHIPIFDPKEK